eukprot:5067266-Prymnesium_polylepis.1
MASVSARSRTASKDAGDGTPTVSGRYSKVDTPSRSIAVEVQLASDKLGGGTTSTKMTSASQAAQTKKIMARTDSKYQNWIIAVVLFAVLMDLLGTVLVFPTLGPLCQNAKKGPVDLVMSLPNETIIAAGYPNHAAYLEAVVKPNPRAFKQSDIPFEFSLATNMIMFFASTGQGLGAYVWGKASDRIGSKLCIQICLSGGLGGYMIIYASGVWIGSYWLFILGMWLNGFFGASAVIATAYFGKLFDGEKAEKYIQLVLAMSLVPRARFTHF